MAVGKDSILRAQKAGQVEAAAKAAEKPGQGTQEQQDGAPAEAEKKPAARKRTVKKTAAGAKKKPAAQKEAADDTKRPVGTVSLTDEMPYYLL